MYANGSVKRYLDDLAARKPAPGGGSAAALEAATGCALISMVANFTISNKKYADFKKDAEETLKRSEHLRKKLIELIDEDVKAYTKLEEGLKKYGGKDPRLEILYKEACSIPYDIAICADEAMKLCAAIVKFGNKNLITDTAIAALMLESAFFGAKFNVYINLRYIERDAYTEKIHNILSALEEKIPRMKEEILRACEEVIMR